MEIGYASKFQSDKSMCIEVCLKTPGAQIFTAFFFLFFWPWLIATLCVPIIICSSMTVVHPYCQSAGGGGLHAYSVRM